MKKKLIPILLSMMFIVSSFMTITAFAASPASQDGLTVTLTLSKTTYTANEDIDLSLTVTNNNAYAVDGIQTVVTLPEGITLQSGGLTQNAFNLAAGESKNNSAAVIKNVTVTPPQKPDDTKSPQTSDSSNMAIWLTPMLVSAGALVFLAIKNKKIKSKGVLSLFLCFAVLATVGLPITANAASTQKSFTVTEDLTVDGKAVTISAEIYYGYVAHNTVTVTNGTGSATYAEGDTVTITADTAPVGKHFTKWIVVSGSITLADVSKETTTFTMPDKAVEVTANYEVNTYTITATSDSNGAVSPVGAITVNHGDSKTFDFTPKTGYHIKEVTVDGESKGIITSYTFDSVTKDHIISVTFEIDTFDITATSGVNGTISPSGVTSVAYGGNKTYTITSNTGYHIADVKVDGVSKGTIGTYTFDNVTATHTIEATFAINTYTITASSDSNGAISPAGAITVNHGEDKAFTITPNDGYHVVDVLVDGASVGAVTEYTFTNITANGHTISATFAKNTYTVTVNNGTIQGGTTTVAWGDTVTIVADTPTVDKEFKDWAVVSGGITLADSTQATTTFTMPSNVVEITANYQPSAANAEAAKITGALRDDFSSSTYPTIFTLQFGSPLSAGATINITDVYRGDTGVFDNTTYSFDSSTNKVSFNIDRSKIKGITNTYILYTVTFNGVESDERSINIW